MRYFNLHTHHYTNTANVIEIVNLYPHEFDDAIPYFSIGIHPWHITENRISEELTIIESKLQSKKCIAIGECGLDKRIEIRMQLQSDVYKKQLFIAQKNKKPVVIHCVAAFQEVIAIKKEMRITVPMIIHGFSKNEQTAKQLLDNGFYLSFGKYLLRNPELESVFAMVPNDRFFLETDTIDESIIDVYKLAARYKNISVPALQLQIETNFKTVFNF